MIEIKAATRRVFLFPAPVSQAHDFYSSFRRITQFLPHISLVREFDKDRFRLLYSTVEVAGYEVHIFADVATQIDGLSRTITIEPARNITPVKSKATLTSLTAPGSYKSRSFFKDVDESQCEIEYVMELGARLPRPLGLKFIPASVLNNIATNITNHRMEEIIDGFIAKSILAFQH